MKIPNKINVSGYTLTVKYGKKILVNGVECFGVYNPNTKIISLTKGMSPTRKKEIFIHEYLHFLEDIYRIKISEEGVSSIALGLLAMLNNEKVNLND